MDDDSKQILFMIGTIIVVVTLLLVLIEVTNYLISKDNYFHKGNSTYKMTGYGRCGYSGINVLNNRTIDCAVDVEIYKK